MLFQLFDRGGRYEDEEGTRKEREGHGGPLFGVDVV